jgi:signal transduction histidine kinase
VNVDPLQVEQVIINLVRNSVEALSDAGRYDGKVMIEADRDNEGCVPFTTTKQDGLGLGLSLARSIVEAHGGRLMIDSSSNGAVVSFTLPVVVTQQEFA